MKTRLTKAQYEQFNRAIKQFDQNGIPRRNGGIFVEWDPDDDTAILLHFFECIPQNNGPKRKCRYTMKISYSSDRVISPCDDKLDRLSANTELVNFINDKSGLHHIVFDNCKSLEDFCEKNPKFMMYSGWGCFLNYIQENHYYPLEPHFQHIAFDYLIVFFICRSIEQVLKMGYEEFVYILCEQVYSSKGLTHLANVLYSLRYLVRASATKGKDALVIPRFVLEFLLSKNAVYDLYVGFSIIFLNDKSLNKDKFFKILESKEYQYIFQSYDTSWFFVGAFCRATYYGFGFYRTLKYLYKNAYLFRNVNSLVRLFGDYLSMCKTLGFKPDELPINLKAEHDRLAELVKEEQVKSCEEAISHTYSKYNDIATEVSNNSNSFLIKLPVCTMDLIQEGKEQHNCVGSYGNNIKHGSIVFFIRKKDNPEKSFVTAEVYNGKLLQILKKYNLPVEDDNVLKFGERFCKKVLATV